MRNVAGWVGSHRHHCTAAPARRLKSDDGQVQTALDPEP